MPELFEDLERVYGSFMDLHNTRTSGFGPNPITISEITAWLNLHWIASLDDRLFFDKCIRHLDAIWLTHYANTRSGN